MKKIILTTILVSIVHLPFNAGAQSTNKGMTWRVVGSAQGVEKVHGAVVVGCGYNSGAGLGSGAECNPYEGDSSCSLVLPVLCIYDNAFSRPATIPVGTFTRSWSGGLVATTAEIAGNTFSNVGEVTAYCKSQFGGNWRVAEFHDGENIDNPSAGWNFKAYGNIGSDVTAKRFWVDINDQEANCWD